MNKLIALFVLALAFSSPAFSIGTAFSFQGSLEDGAAPASGNYDLQFRLLNPLNSQFGPTLVLDDVPVVAGVFTVQLDFGSGVLSGNDRLLEIGVRPGASTGSFTMLAPNTPLNPVPYAQLAALAEVAEYATSVAGNSVFSNDIVNGNVLTEDLGDNAVTVDKLANNSVTLANLLGANYASPANLSAAVPAHTCGQFDISVGGGFAVGDFVVGMPNSTFPSEVIPSFGVVVSPNVVRMRFCNIGSSTQTMVNESIRLISLR